MSKPIIISYEINIRLHYDEDLQTIAVYKDLETAKRIYNELLDGIENGTYLELGQTIRSDLDYFDNIYTTLLSNKTKDEKYLLLWSNSSGDYGDYIETEKELTEEIFNAICGEVMDINGWEDNDIIDEIKNKCIITKMDSDEERKLRERHECDNINVYYYN